MIVTIAHTGTILVSYLPVWFRSLSFQRDFLGGSPQVLLAWQSSRNRLILLALSNIDHPLLPDSTGLVLAGPPPAS